MNLLLVLALLVAVRLASVFVVRTYYVPDEYWQSLEVAHKLVFGYGYLTWEWMQGIRSYIYPLVFAIVYKILALLNLDKVQLLIILPRILQALLSAYSDYRFFVWSGKRKWALFLITVPWFWFYIGSRTLTNTLEASLTTIALSYFPWHGGDSVVYLWLAALTCFLRPTAAIIWVPLCIYHLRHTKTPVRDLILQRFLPIGLAVVAICISVDSYFYGRFIITPYEFIRYNIFYNIGSFYGTHPWHWYFTTGLPTVLGITFIPFIFTVVQIIRQHRLYPIQKQILITIVLSLLALSLVEHKEFRFVASLLPLCLFITSDSLTRWSYNASRGLLWFTAISIVVGNLVPALYLSTVHQRGPIDLMPRIQEIAREYREDNGRQASILYLMPCHSTPYFSHVHENVTQRFLTCEPNLERKPHYRDEADQFYESPVHWLRSHVPSYPLTALPSHVVLHEPLVSKIGEFLRNYQLLFTIENSQLNENVVPQQALDEWSKLLKEKEIKVDGLLMQLQIQTGKNILVYQRLRPGEENAFNRDEVRPKTQRSVPVRSQENFANEEDEQNYFN